MTALLFSSTQDFALIEDRSGIAGHTSLLPAFLKSRKGGAPGSTVPSWMTRTYQPVKPVR